MSEREPTPETRREQWLTELTGFLAESYQHGWAAGAEKTKDPQTGEKTLVYERGDWLYIDKYTGYFVAPGDTRVFHKGKHVWSMSYGGMGQYPEHYDEVQATFAFLKEALQAFDPSSPLRGPKEYNDTSGEWAYRFFLQGDIENGEWREYIHKRAAYRDPYTQTGTYFEQNGTCGIIIDKDSDYNPIYPWDL